MAIQFFVQVTDLINNKQYIENYPFLFIIRSYLYNQASSQHQRIEVFDTSAGNNREGGGALLPFGGYGGGFECTQLKSQLNI